MHLTNSADETLIMSSEFFETQSTLYRALFHDIARHFPQRTSLDCDYLLSRLKNEGIAFIFTTLPMLGKAVENSLIAYEPLKVPCGWRLSKKSRLPLFLNSLFQELFDDEGQPRWALEMRPAPDLAYHSLAYIRQVCMLYSKVEVGKHDETPFLQAFAKRICETRSVTCDSEVLNLARYMIRNVLESDYPEASELRDFERNPWGRHGPGAVADGEKGPEKWQFKKLPNVPESLFRINERLVVASQAANVSSARVVCVPKDFRGPRIICIEPKENQFAQQGLMDILYRLLMRHSVSRRAIDFIDVSESRHACYDYTQATIDLKDASDRISLELAKLLLPRWFYKLVTRYRSANVEVLGKLYTPRCLATMGNATCFPLQTMIFWALAQATVTVVRASHSALHRHNLTGFVRVFGDDIIVPLWACDAVCDNLQRSGLVINDQKTCSFSLVRESCGEWVYDGRAIVTTRLRSPQVVDLRSWVQFRDYAKTCAYPALAQALTDTYNAYIDESALPRRFNKHLQRSEVRLPCFVTKGDRPQLDNEAGLYAYFVSNDRTPFLDGARLRVKQRWVSDATFVVR